MLSKLQYISQGRTAAEQETNISRALDAGVEWVQLRWKNAAEHELAALAERVLQRCHDHNALCIINDSVALADKVGADGVHLGLSDGSAIEARAVLGATKLIGGTANTLQDVLQRVAEGCDYIGLGPFRFTRTKQHLSPVLGLDGYERIFSMLHRRAIAFPPVYAIGGIRLPDVDQLMCIGGIHGLALSALITDGPALIPVIKSKLR